ncbi:MAG: regulatory protein RecX [Clostridia bacterium]|nr:regulatory protein RecX [Clostridia bacterium]
MVVTKIEPQKKDKNRSSVYIDDSFAFGIDNFDLLKLKIKVGIELDSERLEFIHQTVLLSAAKNYGMKLTSARSYTKAALLRKMFEKGFDEREINQTIAFLEEYKLLDDEEYARRFVNDCINIKGYGKFRIKNDLREKGIDKDTADKILSEYDFNEIEEEKILPLAQKKLGGDFTIQNIAKTKRYLASRGFGFDAIDSAIRKIAGGEEWSEC